jgi:hypothetical protein
MSTDSHKNFSFIRVHPIKKWGKGDLKKSRKQWGLTGNVAHDLRFIHAPNADPDLIGTNLILCAETGWNPMSPTKENLKTVGIKGATFLASKAVDMLAEKGVVVRKNLVKVAMLMAAVSPEYLRDGNLGNEPNPEKSRKLLEGTTAYLRKKYGDRLLMVVYHGDEQNPHVSAYILPLIEKSITVTGRTEKGMENQPRETSVEWRLAFYEFFRRDKRILDGNPDPKKKKFLGYERGPCTVLQDEFAEALRTHGLDVQRGIRKADEDRALQYEPTKVRYDRLQTPATEIEGMDFEQLRAWAAQAIPHIQELKRAREERDNYQKTSGHHQQNATKLENQIAEMKREIPVEKVIKKLTGLDPQEAGFGDLPELEPSKKRKDLEQEFLLPNGQRVGITNNNGFENLTPEIPFPVPNAKRFKGRGAISAVKYLTGWDHSQATAWLADNFDDDTASREIARNFREEISVDRDEPTRVRRKNHAVEILSDLQTPDDSRWPDACRALTETFQLRSEPVEELRRSEWIAANRHGHFIFQKLQLTAAGLTPTGSLIVDPQHPSIILSDIGEGLHIQPGDDKQLIICATPMDALAIKSSRTNRDATVVTIGGNPSEATQATLRQLIENHRGIKLIAENLSMVGQRLAVWIGLHFSALGKLALPGGCANWFNAHRLAPPGSATAHPKMDRTTEESQRTATVNKEDPTLPRPIGTEIL